jgi:CRISPR-associated protein Cas1
MIGRIIEIAGEGRYLSMERGFLHVRSKGGLLGQVPLDDIAALIANTHALSYSNQLLLALAERGVPVVLCGNNHNPAAIVWPIENHHR